MAKTFSYPSTRKTTLGARLKIVILPLNVRIPPTYTITTTRAFNSNIDPGIIYLKSNVETYLSAETKLTFAGVTIEVAEEVYLTTTETLVSIIDIDPNKTIAINTSTTSKALILVSGAKNFNINPEIQTVETTNVSHGVEKEEKQTFNSKKINFDIIEIYKDTGGFILLNMCDNLTSRNREFWFNYSYPDGSFREGAALITSASFTSNMQGLRSFRVEARVQPNTYNFLYEV